MRRDALILAGLLSLAATYRINPGGDGPKPQPGDTILVADGEYGALVVDASDVTYVAVAPGAAVFREISLKPGTSGVTVEGLTVRGAQGVGVTVRGQRHVFRNVRSVGSRLHGFLIGCNVPWPWPEAGCPDRPVGVTLSQVESLESGHDGIKIDAAVDLVISWSRIVDSRRNGLFEGASSLRARIEDNVFLNNGLDDHANGLYLKGQSSMVRRNRVINSGAYGIVCWAACFGTPDALYQILGNRLCTNRNGDAVRIGGTASEAMPPGDGFPHYLNVADNEGCL